MDVAVFLMNSIPHFYTVQGPGQSRSEVFFLDLDSDLRSSPDFLQTWPCGGGPGPRPGLNGPGPSPSQKNGEKCIYLFSRGGASSTKYLPMQYVYICIVICDFHYVIPTTFFVSYQSLFLEWTLETAGLSGLTEDKRNVTVECSVQG